jgi:hypothetical protein
MRTTSTCHGFGLTPKLFVVDHHAGVYLGASDFIHASWVVIVRVHQSLFQVVRPRQGRVFSNVLQR